MKARLTHADLMSLERYHLERPSFRRRVIEHKAIRQIFLGPHVSLTFEDSLTIQYQIQEMLRIERIFEAGAIQEEIEVYNALLPDGDNWKATMMIEYEDVEERRIALMQLHGIEHRIGFTIGDASPVCAIADEDLERSRDNKTSAVHFLRFQLTQELVRRLREGASLGVVVDHSSYQYAISDLPVRTRESLIGDLN